jgi:hypothetical protein
VTTPTESDLLPRRSPSAVPVTASAPPEASAAKVPDAEPAAAEESKPDPIPTGFPEPVAADEPREPSPDGMVRLAPVGFGYLTVPPLEVGGESVVITAEGTDCDEETAARAHEAAGLAGFRLKEV